MSEVHFYSKAYEDDDSLRRNFFYDLSLGSMTLGEDRTISVWLQDEEGPLVEFAAAEPKTESGFAELQIDDIASVIAKNAVSEIRRVQLAETVTPRDLIKVEW
jgi:hypothetical protein